MFVLAVGAPPAMAELDLSDESAIVAAARAGASARDAGRAETFESQARRRQADAGRAKQSSWGPLAKLWCDAAAMAPSPSNLSECARARVGAVEEMSNPQPSRIDARMNAKRHALVLLEAAREIAAFRPTERAETRAQISRDVDCLRAGAGRPDAGCRPPYDR